MGRKSQKVDMWRLSPGFNAFGVELAEQDKHLVFRSDAYCRCEATRPDGFSVCSIKLDWSLRPHVDEQENPSEHTQWAASTASSLGAAEQYSTRLEIMCDWHS